jgi:hypothetical protein
MRLDKERVSAVVATVILHAIFFFFLMQQGSFRPRVREPGKEYALQVVWIDPEKPESVPKVDEERSSIARKKVSTAAHQRKSSSPEGRAPADSPVSPMALPTVIGDDNWSPFSDAARQNDAAPAGRFERNPLARPDASMDSRESRLQVEVRDRSVGGWIQRQTKRSICSDLKRQLTSAQGSSADVIVATMGRYGCKP